MKVSFVILGILLGMFTLSWGQLFGILIGSASPEDKEAIFETVKNATNKAKEVVQKSDNTESSAKQVVQSQENQSVIKAASAPASIDSPAIVTPQENPPVQPNTESSAEERVQNP